MPQPSIDTILKDPSTSYWLKHAIKSALKRDPVDALRDAETLVELLKAKLENRS